MRTTTIVALAVAGAASAGAVGMLCLGGAPREATQGTAATADEVAARLVKNPATLLRPGEDWHDLPAPARTIWTTWRFVLMAAGDIPWAVGDGLPTVAEMEAGFNALGLPKATGLVGGYAAAEAAPERKAACQARFQGMRAEIAGARFSYLRTHLDEAVRRGE